MSHNLCSSLAVVTEVQLLKLPTSESNKFCDQILQDIQQSENPQNNPRNVNEELWRDDPLASESLCKASIPVG